MRAFASGLRWGVEQRLEFIEFRLFWEGGVNRSDITGFFGVSVPQASKDLSQYQEIAPENVRYDRSGKRYVASDDFRPRFLKPDADAFLAWLGQEREDAGWLARPPQMDVMPVPGRRVEAEVLRRMLAAVRGRRSVEVLYQSMNRERADGPSWRRVSPHAFGSDGMRWYVRARCHIDGVFKDFILSRCLDVRGDGPARGEPADDRNWTTFLDVELAPNPGLSAGQQAVIAGDYGMTQGRVRVPVRVALLYYFIKRHRLDLVDLADTPHEVPVVLVDSAAVEAALSRSAG